MKLPKSLLIKDTVSLFSGKYQYKVCLITPAAGWFRSKDFGYAEERIKNRKTSNLYYPPKTHFKNDQEVTYALKLCDLLKTFEDFDVRVETPTISIYTNNPKQIETLVNLNPDAVKYMCMPNKNNPALEKGAVIVKKLDYQYKAYLGATKQSYENFVQWSTDNKKIKMPKKCTKDLLKSYSFGGGYFYVKDEKTLTMVKMFLGDAIIRVDSVIKA